MRFLKTRTKQLIIVLSCTVGLAAHADDDGKLFELWNDSHKAGVSAVKFQQYNDICGRCHFPYQPGLLPGISWEKVMMDIDRHFGQPVQLTSVEKRTIMRYLLDNSAGHVNDEISNKILQSLKYNPIPMRITQTPYWKYTHSRLSDNNLEKQAYQCNSCHQNAKQGQYKLHNNKQSALKLIKHDVIM